MLLEKLEDRMLLSATVLTTDDRFVFRGEEQPTPSDVTVEEWAYENTDNGKINWYIYGIDLTGNGLQTLGSVKELEVGFSEFTSAGIGLYYTIYTAPQFGGGNAGSFYRSRINYQGDYTFVQSTDDIITASAEVGKTTTSTRVVDGGVTKANVALNLDPGSSVGPQKNTEIVSFIVISTSSGQAAGVEDWAIDEASLTFRNSVSDYTFRTIGTEVPSLTNDPNWDVVNTDLLDYAATIIPTGPDVLPPSETAAMILCSTSEAITGIRVWQARNERFVNPIEPITTSNPAEIIRLLEQRIIYEEDVLYFQVKPEVQGDTYIYAYANYNALTLESTIYKQVTVDITS